MLGLADPVPILTVFSAGRFLPETTEVALSLCNCSRVIRKALLSGLTFPELTKHSPIASSMTYLDPNYYSTYLCKCRSQEG